MKLMTLDWQACDL